MKTTLDHLSEAKQTAITEVRNLILNEADKFLKNKTGALKSNRVTWVVLFGSYARGDFVKEPANGYVSDLDLLVVVNQLDLMHELSLWNAIEEKAERYINAPIALIVHTQGEVKNWLSQGHYFFGDIQREGIVLYSYSGNPLPEPALLSNTKRLPVAQKHFDQWFESASGFVVAYEAMLNTKDFKLAAFMLHQSAERFYSCILLVLSNYRPKTHNIKVLHRMAIDKTLPDSPLTSIFTNNKRFEKRCFELLRRAYIDARYSEHYKITQEELEWLSVQVRKLKEIVKQVCEKHINYLKNNAN